MAKVIKYMPELDGDEQLYVARLMKGMSDEQAQHFAHVYRQRRKDATTTLILALVGFLGFAGIQRFNLQQLWMGLLYFFTVGLCGLGTIFDLFMHRRITSAYNLEQANDIASLIRGAFPLHDEDDEDDPRLLSA